MNNFFKKTKRKRTFFFLTFDILFLYLSFYLAFFLRFEGEIPLEYFQSINYLFFFSIFIVLPIFYLLKLYSLSWSYVSTKELILLLQGLTLSFFLILITVHFQDIITIPRSTLVIAFILMFFFSGALRFFKRIYIETFRKKSKGKKKILIVGAGDAGEQILRSILNLKTTPYYPLGFVDDNSFKQREIIHGVRVLGKIKDLPELIEKHQIKELIIAMPSEGTETIKKAVSLGRKSGIQNIKILPSVHDIIDSNFLISNIKEVDIGELLQRETVKIDFKDIEKFIKGKKVLITGAAGSIGSELCRQVSRFNPEKIIALDRDETGLFYLLQKEKNIISQIADIRDENKMEEVFEKFKPDLVFHAAAYKHVPLMEKDPEEAVKNNIFGTKIVVDKAIKHEADRFIFISTDKAVNPSSVMGATKRMGEMICQSSNGKTKFISVRFGNVLNSRGSVIPIFKEQIEKGGPVKVTHPDMKRYFMLTSEACLLVMQAGAIGQGGEVFVLDMGKPIKIVDLAREMIKLSGLEPDKDIPIVFTQPRPGEKMFEEVLTEKEQVSSTNYQKIFQARLTDVSQEKIKLALEKLKEKNKKTALKEFIPEYNNSF